MSMPQIHIVALCTDLGFSLRVGSEMLSLMLLGGIISRFLSGILSDYVGGVYTLLLGSTLQCISLFLFMPFDGLVPLYIVSLIFGLSQGGIVPSYTMIIREYVPASEAGTKAGLVLMMTILGMAFGGWFSGLIYDLSGSYQIALWNGVLFNKIPTHWRVCKTSISTHFDSNYSSKFFKPIHITYITKDNNISLFVSNC